MAQHFGITAQAVSKWEGGVATPDISLLPDISAYFGVTIDELFSLSDETRMERIQNMLWDGQNEKVAGYYRKALEVQSTPRLVNPYEALAQFYERIGDYAAAVNGLEGRTGHFREGMALYGW